MSCTSDTFWQERLDACKAQIVLYENAIAALSVQGVKSYSLNTGQTIETVTQKDIGSLETQLDRLLNRCAVLDQRINGCASIISVPAF